MPEQQLEGLALRSGALGEHDRLLTVLSEDEGLVRLAVPGGRRPRSSLAAAVPFAHLRLQLGGRRGLRRVRQLRLLRSHASLGERLETLAAAQALAELCLATVPEAAPAEGMLADLLLQFGRLEEIVRERSDRAEALAVAVQGCVHLLALGGYALPLGSCCRSGTPLRPPLGDRDWRCSLVPAEGLVLGEVGGAPLRLGSSELALLQRLLRPALPRRRDGALMGPVPVWLTLLRLLELWCGEHLGRPPRAFRLLRTAFEATPARR